MGAAMAAAGYSAVGMTGGAGKVPGRAQNTGIRLIPWQGAWVGNPRNPARSRARVMTRATLHKIEGAGMTRALDVHSAGWACACGIAFGIGTSTISG